MSLVTPHPKPVSKRSPQRQRRLDWERAYQAARRTVAARSGGICEVCREHRATNTHHKKGRVGPDANRPEHLLHVCVQCDHRITTEPAWAIEHGHSLPRTRSQPAHQEAPQ